MALLKTPSAALAAVILAAVPAFAQSESNDAAQGGTSMQDKIAAADAPDTAETDPVNETATNEIGGAPAMMEINEFAERVFSRGYQHGYSQGVADIRNAFAAELNAVRAEQTAAANGDAQADQDQTQSASNSDGSVEPKGEPLFREVGVGPTGAIVILPEGMTAEAFMEKMTAQQGG